MKNDIENLKKSGFSGFKSVKQLRMSLEDVPQVKGVYVVIRDSEDAPEFVKQGTGGHFKGKNPNKDIEELNMNWVDGSPIVYIGQTERDLRTRIGELIKFGQGYPIAHWGGRILWQLKDAENLLVAWKELPDQAPKEMERSMLTDFRKTYLKLPFANLK